MLTGTLFALAAGLMWGLVFVVPLMLPSYPSVLLSMGRYLAFGLVVLPLAWFDRARLARLTRGDWLEALKLSVVGNVVYYLFLASAIQRAGGPVPTMIIGTLPVVIAVSSNLRDHARDGRLRWLSMLPSLLLIALGIGLVNHAEMALLQSAGNFDVARHGLGALLAVGGVVCWTWYPLRNADWLRSHPDRSPTTWATAQGLTTLPLAVLGAALWWAWEALAVPAERSWATQPLGPQPGLFLGLMLAMGLLASWLGTLCWNQASQRLPTTLVGQLIVFETLAALAYAFVLRGTLPAPETAAGIVALIAGVMWALRVRPEPVPEQGSAH